MYYYTITADDYERDQHLTFSHQFKFTKLEIQKMVLEISSMDKDRILASLLDKEEFVKYFTERGFELIKTDLEVIYYWEADYRKIKSRYDKLVDEEYSKSVKK